MWSPQKRPTVQLSEQLWDQTAGADARRMSDGDEGLFLKIIESAKHHFKHLH